LVGPTGHLRKFTSELVLREGGILGPVANPANGVASSVFTENFGLVR
jgi:hypothetical protein